MDTVDFVFFYGGQRKCQVDGGLSSGCVIDAAKEIVSLGDILFSLVRLFDLVRLPLERGTDSSG